MRPLQYVLLHLSEESASSVPPRYLTSSPESRHAPFARTPRKSERFPPGDLALSRSRILARRVRRADLVLSLPREVPLRVQPLADLLWEYPQDQDQEIRCRHHLSEPPRRGALSEGWGNCRTVCSPTTFPPSRVFESSRRETLPEREDHPRGPAPPAPVRPLVSWKGDTAEREWRHRGEASWQAAAGSWQRAGSEGKRGVDWSIRQLVNLSIGEDGCEELAVCSRQLAESWRGEKVTGPEEASENSSPSASKPLSKNWLSGDIPKRHKEP